MSDIRTPADAARWLREEAQLVLERRPLVNDREALERQAANLEAIAGMVDPPLTEVDVFGRLRAEIRRAGSADAWSKAAGISPTFTSDVLASRRPFSDRMLRALGLSRETVYRRGDAPAPATDLERVLSYLSPVERRALMWLPADGSGRDRRIRDGNWRPSTNELRRLRGFKLADAPGGADWCATELGREAQKVIGEAA